MGFTECFCLIGLAGQFDVIRQQNRPDAVRQMFFHRNSLFFQGFLRNKMNMIQGVFPRDGQNGIIYGTVNRQIRRNGMSFSPDGNFAVIRVGLPQMFGETHLQTNAKFPMADPMLFHVIQ